MTSCWGCLVVSSWGVQMNLDDEESLRFLTGPILSGTRLFGSVSIFKWQKSLNYPETKADLTNSQGVDIIKAVITMKGGDVGFCPYEVSFRLYRSLMISSK